MNGSVGVLDVVNDAESERADEKAHIGGRFVGNDESSLVVVTAW